MRFSTHSALFWSAAAGTLALLAGCSSSNGAATGGNGLGADGGPLNGSGANMGTSGGGGASNGGGASGAGGLLGKLGTTQCSDGIDNDGDGLIDGFDPECTGPLDNDESSFATGIPGDNRDPKWQDCFFDGNSGAGDDGCRYSTDCLTGKLAQTDPNCTLSQQCLDFCKPLVANGCDCFGCCTVATSTGSVDIAIGTGCSLDKINDPTACPVCKKSTSCQNTCGTCELCPGKTEADLPASCAAPPPPDGGTVVGPPPPSYTCDNGLQVCSATIPCPSSYYCSLGCCIAILR